MDRTAGKANGTDESTERQWEYYVAMGQGHDHLLRCKDCRALVQMSDIQTSAGCPKCGCRRITQINTLSATEWCKIRFGLVRFKHWDLFLNEFPSPLQQLLRRFRRG